ncbi:CTP-dependent riboflavin kinase [Fervidicoccus fontis]|uniref:Riboflavin kinase n=1 Tax=Fervidicoccus fontis TaxID=683846 RepID=A0A843AJ57_9CREN|nr:DUF120 domain-containing protein [Fervidicoccus fontis]MBE9390981.1 CTP-dependent riboflavin kinase [Fervidicoccus fontis]
MNYEDARFGMLLILIFDGKKRTRTTQKALSEKIGLSQQSISRILRELEAQGIIYRIVEGKGEYLEITEKGLKLVETLWSKAESIVKEEKDVLILEGEIVEGLGEGRFYIKLPYYSKKIQELVGFVPYPGTLNVRLKGESVLKRAFLNPEKGLRIEGFRNEERYYGGATLFPVKVNGYEKAAIIIPDRTSHEKDIIEIVAPDYLRGELGLKNGSKVVLEVKTKSVGQ